MIKVQILVAVLLLLNLGCSERQEAESQKQSVRTSRQSAPPGGLTFQQTKREEYKTQLKALREAYERSIQEFKKRAEERGATEKLDARIEELQRKTEAVNEILERLDTASLNTWQELKPDIHAALDDLEAAYDNALSEMRDLEPPSRALSRGRPAGKAVVPVKAGGG